MTLHRFPLLIGRLLLVAATVALGLLSLPGGRWPLLVFVSLVPLGLALHHSSSTECFLYAYGCGVTGWIAATGGLIAGLSSYSRISYGTAALVVALGCAVLAVPYGVFGLFYGRYQWMTGRLGALKTAACLTVVLSFFPSPFPLDSSHALYEFPVLVQLLELGGQPLLLFTLLMINWLLVELIVRVRERRNYWSSAAWIASICLVVIGYGYFRLTRLRADEARATPDQVLRVAVIQPNIALENDSSSHSPDTFNQLQILLDQSASLLSAGNQIDVVVWPETPIRIGCGAEPASLRPEISTLVVRYGVPFLINCAQPAGGGKVYNTQLLITPSGEAYAYHKQILFPFTEFIPGERRLPALKRLLPGASQYAAARDSVVLPVTNSIRVFSAICYEILFPGQTRKFIERGGNVMISPANDAWFGTTRIPEFQIAEGVYQAVQFRVPVVRVSNSGNSVGIKASGEIVAGSRTAAFTKTTTVVEVIVPPSRTAYFFIGDLFLDVLALGWLFSLVFDFRLRIKRSRLGSADSNGRTVKILRPVYDNQSLRGQLLRIGLRRRP
jgi:apolipoprotein N-acyltransferase